MTNHRIQMLMQFVKDDPNDAFSKYALALEYMNAGMQEAMKYFDDLLQHHPDYLPTYYMSAQYKWEHGAKQEALEVLKLGISLAEKQHNHHILAELKNSLENKILDLNE